MSAASKPSTARRNAVAAVTLLLAAAGPTALGFVPSAGPFWALLLFPGIAAIITAVILQVAHVHREASRAAERDRSEAEERIEVRQQFRDALRPISELIAQLPALSYADRALRLQGIAQAATTGLYMLLSPHAKGVRANVFSLHDGPDRMTWLAHTGRGVTPRPFMSGTARGDAALEFVTRLEPVMYADLTAKRPAGYEGSMSDYETFIAVPVWTDESVYGMVTIDAPTKNTLTVGDQYLVELVAELMATAFAVAAIEPPGVPAVSEASS